MAEKRSRLGNEAIFARLLASQRSGIGVLPPDLGLGPERFRQLIARYFVNEEVLAPFHPGVSWLERGASARRFTSFSSLIALARTPQRLGWRAPSLPVAWGATTFGKTLACGAVRSLARSWGRTSRGLRRRTCST